MSDTFEIGPPPVPVLPAPLSMRLATAGGEDLDRVHRWMNLPHVAAGWKQDWPRDRWAGELARQLAGDHSRPVIVYDGDRPVGYMELYRVARDLLAPYYPALPHDLGVHTCVGEPSYIGRGFGRRLLRAVAQGLLDADPDSRRVMGEPNAANPAAVKACLHAGFRYLGDVRLPHKTAALLVFPRTDADVPR